jgi:hypothetical protein
MRHVRRVLGDDRPVGLLCDDKPEEIVSYLVRDIRL